MEGGETSLLCRNLDCTFAESGKCVEGHDVDTCHYRQPTDDDEALASDEASAPADEVEADNISDDVAADRVDIGLDSPLVL